MGATKIILLGYDMQTSEQSHWFGEHPEGPMRVASHYADWVTKFNALASDLEQRGIEVINATRETALKCFKRTTIEQAL